MGSNDLALSSTTGKWLCLEFTNSVENYRLDVPLDDIPDFSRWIQWSRRHGVISPAQVERLLALALERREEAEAALKEAHEFRIQLFRLFSARAAGAVPTESQLELLNSRLPASLVRLKLATADGQLGWRWHEVAGFEGLLGPIVYSAALLLTGPQAAQLRQCGGDKCTWLFIDESKNQSRRWCDMKICGNRAKSRRHYQRQHSPAP